MVVALTDRRRWLFRSAAVLFGLALACVVIEGAVRVFPGLLSSKLRHAAFSKYDTLPGGIFLTEGITRMRFMRADFTTRAYSHGRFWTHSTDGHGFRNPAGLTDRRVLLLGDSLVYGHGVEGDQTVGHYLRNRGVAAYDLSAQGQCLYEHYVLARLFLEEFHPETVLLFVFVNDIRDLEKTRRTELVPELQEIHSFDYELIGERVERLQRFREPWPVRAAMGSSIVRMIAKSSRWRPPKPPESIPLKGPHGFIGRDSTQVGRSVPGAVLDNARFEPLERYYDLILGDLSRRCRDLGIRLVLVHLVPPDQKSWRERDRAQTRFQTSLEAIAERHTIELVDTNAFFAGHTEWILVGDGHLNPTGNRELAAFLHTTVFPPP